MNARLDSLALTVETACHSGTHRAAGNVQTSDFYFFAVVAVLLRDRVQRRNSGCIPEVGLREIDDDPVRVLSVVEQRV